MRRRLESVLSTHTVRQSAVTTISTFLSAGFGAVFYLLLARVLGTSDYGLFSLSLTVLMLLVTVSDVGMGQGLVRFVGENRNSDKYFPFAALALKTKIIIGAGCWLVLWIFAGPLASIVFHQPGLAPLLPVVGLGIFSYLLISYSLAITQALQKFIVWGGLQIGSNLIRLLFLCLLFLLHGVNSYTALVIFAAASFIGFAISWAWLDRRIITASFSAHHSHEFWGFNKWTGAFMILSSIVARLDVLLTARFLDISSIGAYSLAVTMVSFMPQLSTAIGAVTASRFASVGDKKMADDYLKKATLFSFGVSLGVTALMVPAATFVIWFTGRDYAQAFVPFLVLLLSMLVFMAGNPLRDYILYFSHRPRIFFWTNLGQGLVFLGLGLILIPRFGILGTALSVLAGQVFLGAACLRYYLETKE